jgi:hypothetical protein
MAYIKKFTPGVMIRKIHHQGFLMIFSQTKEKELSSLAQLLMEIISIML